VAPGKYPHLYAWQQALLYRAAWASTGVGFSSKAFSNCSRASLTYTSAYKMTSDLSIEIIKKEPTEEFDQTRGLLNEPISEIYYGIVDTPRHLNIILLAIIFTQITDSFFTKVLILVSCQPQTKALRSTTPN
jgi:hypothetical protein